MEASPPTLYALVVDDNRLTQSVLAQTLTHLEVPFADIVLASTGVEAMECYQELVARDQHGEVLILLDLDMPVMGGLEAMSLIRIYEQEHRLPPSRIVVVSALTDDETVKNCYANGADNFFAKPVKAHELLEYLREE